MQLVFLIGSGRSGTKFLRDTLVADNKITRVPYDINYFWRYGNQSLPHDEISIEDLDEKQRAWIKKNIFRFIDKDLVRCNPAVVIEKTVANTFRVELLSKLFPDAKFVHLIRDGREVTESAIRLWSKPAKVSDIKDKLRYYPFSEFSYALWFFKEQLKHRFSKEIPIWGTRYRGITQDVKDMPLHIICAKQWALGVRSALHDFSNLATDQYIEVRYSDLVSNERVLSNICEFISIEPSAIVERWRSSVDPSNKSKWRTSMPDDILEDILTVFEEILPERTELYSG